MPQRVEYRGIIVTLSRLFSSLKMLTCENFVMPVMKTKRSHGSQSFRQPKSERTMVRISFSFSGSWSVARRGASYSSMMTTVFSPVLMGNCSIRCWKRSPGMSLFLSMPNSSSYLLSCKLIFALNSSAVPAFMLARLMSSTGCCGHLLSNCSMASPSKRSRRPSK